MFSQHILTILNHLLTQSGWALPRLAQFSGKTARFNIAPFSIACTIEGQGTLREADAEVSVDASLNIPFSLLPRLVLQEEIAFKQIESSGDAVLINEILYLARNLRWDAAEDLSRVTGDIAAERMVQFAKAKHQLMRDNVHNLSQALTEYWIEERPLLAKPQRLADWARKVNRVSDEVNQLERRIATLSRVEESK